MYFFSLFGALLVGGGTGALAERFGLVRNGYVLSIILGIGGATALFFVPKLLGFNLGFGRFLTAVIGAAGALFLNSMRR